MIALARALDALVALFLGLWLSGGISWGGRLWIKHGADPRRAALIIGLLLVAVPALRARSWVAQRALRAARVLEERRGVRWGLLVAVAAYASFLSGLQTLALRYPLWDVGIFHQIVWNLSQGNGFGSSLSDAGDFLRDHLSISLVVLAPLMDLAGGSPLFMPVIQPWLVYAGVAAWLHLAEREAGQERKKAWLPAVVLVFGISFDSLWGNFRWGPHESMIAFFALSWMFVIILPRIYQEKEISTPRENAIKGIALFLGIVAAGTKEILLLNVALALGIWSATSYRKRLWGWSGLLLGFAISLVIGFVYFEQMPHAVGKNYFLRYYAYLGHSLPEFAETLLLKPWRVVQAVGVGELARYGLVVFLPFLFLPFLSRYRIWILTIGPSFMSAAIATYPPLRRAYFHYVLELWPILATLTVLVLASRGSRKLGWVWAFCSLLVMDQDPVGLLREYWRDAERARPARIAMQTIPPELSLMAGEMAGTWVSSRAFLSRWPDLIPFGGSCPERLLMPVGAGELKDYPGAKEVLERCSYTPLWGAGDWVLYKLASPRVATFAQNGPN